MDYDHLFTRVRTRILSQNTEQGGLAEARRETRKRLTEPKAVVNRFANQLSKGKLPSLTFSILNSTIYSQKTICLQLDRLFFNFFKKHLLPGVTNRDWRNKPDTCQTARLRVAPLNHGYEHPGSSHGALVILYPLSFKLLFLYEKLVTS